MARGRRPKAAKVAEEGGDETMIEEAADEEPLIDDGAEETKEAAVDDLMPIEGVEESKEEEEDETIQGLARKDDESDEDDDNQDRNPSKISAEAKAMLTLHRTVIEMTEAEAKRVMEEGLVTIDDYRILTIEDINNMTKKLRLSTIKCSRVRCLAQWVQAQAEDIQPKAFSTAVMIQEMIAINARANSKSDYEDKKAAIKPEHWNGGAARWQTFWLQLESYVGALGADNHMVISHSEERYKKPDPTATDAADDTDPKFLSDARNHVTRNGRIFNLLKSLTSNGSAWPIIECYNDTQDGRQAWIALCAFNEGSGISTLTEKEAQQKIMNSKYNGKSRNYTFAKYVQTHIGANNKLDRTKGRGFTDSQKTDFFLDGIMDPRFAASVATARANPTWTYNYTVTYLRTEAGRVTNEGRTGGDDNHRSARFVRGKRKQGDKFPKNKRQKWATNESPSTQLITEIWSKLSKTAKKEVVDAKRAYTTERKANSVNQNSETADEYSKSTRSRNKHTVALDKSSDKRNRNKTVHFAKKPTDMSVTSTRKQKRDRKI